MASALANMRAHSAEVAATPSQIIKRGRHALEASAIGLPTTSIVADARTFTPSSTASTFNLLAMSTSDLETINTNKAHVGVTPGKTDPNAAPGAQSTNILAKPTQVSRYAKLGLNRKSLKFAGWKAPSTGLSVHTPIYIEMDSNPSTSSHHTSIPNPDKDLIELETMMVPPALWQGLREGGAVPVQPLPALHNVKTSKYSTGILSSSGWTAINNPSWLIRDDHIPGEAASEDVMVTTVGYDDLPGQLAKAKDRHQLPLSKEKLDEVTLAYRKHIHEPLVKRKYFDLDNYMEHA